jgi:hypothetical protein
MPKHKTIPSSLKLGISTRDDLPDGRRILGNPEIPRSSRREGNSGFRDFGLARVTP